MTATAQVRTNTAAIELLSLSIGYQPSRKETKVVAENLNATLRAGELVCLLGPNGAGKSTLMRTMAGMQKPLSGRVELSGVNIHDLPARELAKKLSVVLTERISIGAMTAYSLVALGRYPHTNWAGTLSDKDHEVIQWSLQTTGASEFANQQIGELSDGERQRVRVARALAQEPQLMILDEITAFLDLPRRRTMDKAGAGTQRLFGHRSAARDPLSAENISPAINLGIDYGTGHDDLPIAARPARRAHDTMIGQS